MAFRLSQDKGSFLYLYFFDRNAFIIKEDIMANNNSAKNVSEYFGCNVFSDKVMRERLPKDVYKSVQRTKKLGTAIDKNIADVVANAMKD